MLAMLVDTYYAVRDWLEAQLFRAIDWCVDPNKTINPYLGLALVLLCILVTVYVENH